MRDRVRSIEINGHPSGAKQGRDTIFAPARALIEDHGDGDSALAGRYKRVGDRFARKGVGEDAHVLLGAVYLADDHSANVVSGREEAFYLRTAMASGKK